MPVGASPEPSAYGPGCAEARARLEALVDGDLPKAQAEAVRAHLAGCAACRAHHREACSLPPRLYAICPPDPSPDLVPGVLARVRAERIGPFRLWSPLVVELVLFALVVWYLSGPRGLARLVQRAASDVGALAGWGIGLSSLPAVPPGDVFLLLVSGLLVVVTLYHLSLLAARLGPGLL
ncbi:MAG TPA: zf-HC2 domain-containing protein [Candidatus Dormibacteraeota bacterium]|nr:zf-HC2 domain-containing protein [Candidatus Dormibacteraeota bacterium]